METRPTTGRGVHHPCLGNMREPGKSCLGGPSVYDYGSCGPIHSQKYLCPGWTHLFGYRRPAGVWPETSNRIRICSVSSNLNYSIGREERSLAFTQKRG